MSNKNHSSKVVDERPAEVLFPQLVARGPGPPRPPTRHAVEAQAKRNAMASPSHAAPAPPPHPRPKQGRTKKHHVTPISTTMSPRGAAEEQEEANTSPLSSPTAVDPAGIALPPSPRVVLTRPSPKNADLSASIPRTSEIKESTTIPVQPSPPQDSPSSLSPSPTGKKPAQIPMAPMPWENHRPISRKTVAFGSPRNQNQPTVMERAQEELRRYLQNLEDEKAKARKEAFRKSLKDTPMFVLNEKITSSPEDFVDWMDKNRDAMDEDQRYLWQQAYSATRQNRLLTPRLIEGFEIPPPEIPNRSVTDGSGVGGGDDRAVESLLDFESMKYKKGWKHGDPLDFFERTVEVKRKPEPDSNFVGLPPVMTSRNEAEKPLAPVRKRLQRQTTAAVSRIFAEEQFSVSLINVDHNSPPGGSTPRESRGSSGDLVMKSESSVSPRKRKTKMHKTARIDVPKLNLTRSKSLQALNLAIDDNVIGSPSPNSTNPISGGGAQSARMPLRMSTMVSPTAASRFQRLKSTRFLNGQGVHSAPVPYEPAVLDFRTIWASSAQLAKKANDHKEDLWTHADRVELYMKKTRENVREMMQKLLEDERELGQRVEFRKIQKPL